MKNLMMDFYELTMGQVYFDTKSSGDIVYFDLFFRKCPDKAPFAVVNGVAKCIDYLLNFKFDKEDIDYLKTLKIFSDNYLAFLKQLKFTGEVWGMKDGDIVLPYEPILTIRAPIVEAQLVETALLLLINHSSLITTKANRIVRSAKGRAVMEFGSRRAQGEDAAIDGALCAYVGGAVGTACAETGKQYGVPVLGTMAHSLVQKYDNEYEAFKAYADSFGNNCVLLVDTYDVLKSGIPNAIKVQKEVLAPLGKILAGVRIDSGDLLELTKKTRIMLDNAGLQQTKIVVSNSLDEFEIERLLNAGAKIDSFGVGERMITSKSEPVFGGVYKLVAIEQNGKIVPKIKISEDEVKILNPNFKKVFRITENGKIVKDVLTNYDEEIVIQNAQAVQLNNLLIKNGKLVGDVLNIAQARNNLVNGLNQLDEELKDLNSTKHIPLVLSEKLVKLKTEMIKNLKG